MGLANRDSRRRFLGSLATLGFSGWFASACGFFDPTKSEGFGSTINVGRIDDIQAAIDAGAGFFYVPEGRLWLTRYPARSLPAAEAAYNFYSLVEPGLLRGVTALYQTCPHLGCRVPECATSQWFECPCHGSKYDRVGEKRDGPAPRGMDRFPMAVVDDELLVDTGTTLAGPPIGTDTTEQQPSGPFCVSSDAVSSAVDPADD